MRRIGRTTRIIDAAIQTLFTKGKVTIADHHMDSGLERHRAVFDRVVYRLQREHGTSRMRMNRRNLTIELI